MYTNHNFKTKKALKEAGDCAKQLQQSLLQRQKAMISSQDRLCLGLWALDFVETAAKGSWRRFAKFGRAGMEGEAYYVITGTVHNPDLTPDCQPDELWYSPIRVTQPVVLVGSATKESPIFEQFWQAGWKAHQLYQEKGSKLGPNPWKKMTVDADTALDELMKGDKNGTESR